MKAILNRTIRRLFFFFKRSQVDRELAEEMEVHRSLLEHDLIERGFSKADAFHASRRQFGNATLARESSRELWTFRFLESLFQDLRHSVRGLIRSPLFTITAISSLALGIGANSAMFTAVDTLLFRPLPAKDPNQFVTVVAVDATGHDRNTFPRTFADNLRRSNAFSDVVGTVSDGLTFTSGGSAERILGEAVTPNFFTALGVSPVIGQPFTSAVRDGTWLPEAILSYSFWKAHFGGDPHVLGRIIRLNTYPFTVVGVSPSSFFDVYQGQNPELRIPALPPGRSIAQLGILTDNDFSFMARLRPGIRRSQAQALAEFALHDFVRNSTDAEVRRAGYSHLRLLPGARGWPELANSYAAPAIVLFLLAVIAFLIACANVSNIWLARTTARRTEFAVRSSLGAHRRRIIRQILVESLVLSLVAGLLGLIAARWITHLLPYFLPHGHIPFVLDLHIDLSSVLFTCLLSVLAAGLFGLTAAIHGTRGNIAVNLKVNSNAAIGGSTTLRQTLVTVQIAFSVTLLAIAGLFLRSLSNLQPTAEFPQAHRLLLFTMKPQPEIYSATRVRTILDEVVRRVSALPGVESVGLAESGPFSSLPLSDTIQVAGRAPVPVEMDIVTPRLLATIGLPLVSGRDFTAADRPESSKVAIVNQSLAHALFPNQTVLGRTIDLPRAEGPLHFRVVGVVPDTHYFDPHQIRPAVFFAFQLGPPYMPTLCVRVASAAPDIFIPAIRREIDAVDNGFPVFNIRTLADRIHDKLARERMTADLSSAFGGLALVLSAVGLYGVLAYWVVWRTREIGIRLALGSSTNAIVWLVCREALTLLAIGGAAGVIMSIAAGKLLSTRLYGVTWYDPANLLAAITVLLAIGILAAFIPALRACKITPMNAIRYE